MSANSKKTTTKGKRYTDAQKQEVVAYANKVNADNGRGGQAAAARKYGISVLTVSGWLKAGGAPKAAKPVKAAKVAAKKGKKDSPQGKRYTDAQKQEVIAYVLAVNTAKGRGGLSAATAKFHISPLTISGWIKKAGVKMPKAAKAAKPAKVAKAPKAPKAAKPAKVAKVKAPAASGVSPKAVIALGNQIAKLEKQFSKLKMMIGAIK